MPQVLLHVLFEHAAGYALFAVREVEEIGLLLPQVPERQRERGERGAEWRLGTGWGRTRTGTWGENGTHREGVLEKGPGYGGNRR